VDMTLHNLICYLTPRRLLFKNFHLSMGSVFVCVVSCRISHSVHVHANAVLVVFQYA